MSERGRDRKKQIEMERCMEIGEGENVLEEKKQQSSRLRHVHNRHIHCIISTTEQCEYGNHTQVGCSEAVCPHGAMQICVVWICRPLVICGQRAWHS